MRSLSIGATWQESSAFLKKEAGLLVPVALLFIGVPLGLFLYFIPPELRHMQPGTAIDHITIPASTLILFILCSLLIAGGTLALYALALKPGISLAEALALGFRRLPVSLGATLLLGLALLVPITAMRFVAPQLANLVLMILIFAVSARLLVLNAVVVDRPAGVIGAIRESWVLSRGQLMKLLLFLILISIPLMVAQVVAQLLFGLAGMAIGGQEGGRQLGDVGVAAALSLGQMVMIVMTARIYRQLSA